ncbi:hypothetical protein TFLX_04333 [Thermoflexales bacterium]|nr:hypothetical protein TFLX_04333 [Thermoflexales bacterium]
MDRHIKPLKRTGLTFERYRATAQSSFASFPNEQVWRQGGLTPNRQLEKPEAGYCIVLRYDQETTGAITHFMAKIRAILPPIVEYHERHLHTTIGVYGKGDLAGFLPDPPTIKCLRQSIEAGLGSCAQNLQVALGKWLFNNETILIPGYPNQNLWALTQSIGHACALNGLALDMARMAHVTTARFISGVSRQVFEQFVGLTKSAPVIGSVRPSSIDLATWRCDGLTFELATHRRYPLGAKAFQARTDTVGEHDNNLPQK